ncbi:MAG: VWA domain-containing protein [Deltaproteobacteria bacterium]|nr:VWA domain-containing protein [Deltaproteobacteria bacterium]
MSWANNHYLDLLWLVVPLFLLLLAAERRRLSKMGRMVQPSLWKEVFPGFSRGKSRLKVLFLALAVLAIGLACLKPQWGYTLREFKRQGSDLFVVVDTSESMRAQDVSPSRMERAKREVIDLIGMLQGDRVGLIPFAKTATVACPLTGDYETLRLFADQLATDLLPIQGTDIAGALDLALNSFPEGPSTTKAILLITDGEVTAGDLPELNDKAAKAGIKIFVLGVGDTRGAPIPSENGEGFKTDQGGEIVLSRLNEGSLQELARATGGSYARSIAGDSDLEALYVKGIKETLEKRELKSGKKMIPEERFQVPLFLAFLLLGIEFLL